MKYVMTSSLSFIYFTHTFEKPLNPLLGETWEGSMEDGSKLFMEQICHHPPISFITIDGPGNNYRAYGYSSFTPKAHLNSVDLNVTGAKVIEFPDQTKIEYDPHCHTFKNTLFGTLRHIINGKVTFVDKKNGISAWYHIGGASKNVPSDYFVGEIRNMYTN